MEHARPTTRIRATLARTRAESVAAALEQANMEAAATIEPTDPGRGVIQTERGSSAFRTARIQPRPVRLP